MIRADAWWCDYCSNKVPDKTGCDYICSMNVPYYCSSRDCKYWTENKKLTAQLRVRKKLDWGGGDILDEGNVYE